MVLSMEDKEKKRVAVWTRQLRKATKVCIRFADGGQRGWQARDEATRSDAGLRPALNAPPPEGCPTDCSIKNAWSAKTCRPDAGVNGHRYTASPHFLRAQSSSWDAFASDSQYQDGWSDASTRTPHSDCLYQHLALWASGNRPFMHPEISDASAGRQ
ncbi:MAG: hypothetical protein AAF989_07090 [Planctomycetota bacterium]